MEFKLTSDSLFAKLEEYPFSVDIWYEYSITILLIYRINIIW
jgi:hypothetical protein